MTAFVSPFGGRRRLRRFSAFPVSSARGSFAKPNLRSLHISRNGHQRTRTYPLPACSMRLDTELEEEACLQRRKYNHFAMITRLSRVALRVRQHAPRGNAAMDGTQHEQRQPCSTSMSQPLRTGVKPGAWSVCKQLLMGHDGSPSPQKPSSSCVNQSRNGGNDRNLVNSPCLWYSRRA